MSEILSAEAWNVTMGRLVEHDVFYPDYRKVLVDHDRALRSRLAEAEAERDYAVTASAVAQVAAEVRLAEAEELLRFVWEDVRDVDPVGLPREWRDTYARVRAFLGETPQPCPVRCRQPVCPHVERPVL